MADYLFKIRSFIMKICDTYFCNYKINIDEVEKLIINDYQYYIDNNLESRDGMCALIIYRLSCNVVENNPHDNFVDLFYKIKNETVRYTNSYISPYAILSSPISIGEKVVIDKGYNIEKNVVINNYVELINNNYGLYDKKYTNIKNNTIIKHNVKIYSDAHIGSCCIIGEWCIIRDAIADNCEVKLISNIQTRKNTQTSRIPSQELLIYGVVPKYKNSIIIHGEGFYNPKVKVVIPKENVETEIVYWDKNKIIVKLKYLKVENYLKNTLIIFSNGQRIVLTNNMALQKTLKNLQK